MASLEGKTIGAWILRELVDCTNERSIYRGLIFPFCSCTVYPKEDNEQKYFMTIIYKDYDNPDYKEGLSTGSVSFRANVAPMYSYYDFHCTLYPW